MTTARFAATAEHENAGMAIAESDPSRECDGRPPNGSAFSGLLGGVRAWMDRISDEARSDKTLRAAAFGSTWL